MSRLATVRAHWLAALGVALASVGLVLQSPVGVVAAVGLAVTAAFAPAPLGVAFGVVAFTALFDSVTGLRPALTAVGLLVLLLDSAPSLRTTAGRASVAVATPVTVALAGGYAVGLGTGMAGWLLALAVGSTVALVLYGVHRYERVTLGLVHR
ncbi:hypothetical protein [Haloarchaeobius sp. HRN-SO-5]|uniref:hypothetical protein n=1 Tax=Haloarchaeobius sp. HRN-SO-5 TaxID=3446118 RepID=UPI003EB892D3